MVSKKTVNVIWKGVDEFQCVMCERVIKRTHDINDEWGKIRHTYCGDICPKCYPLYEKISDILEKAHKSSFIAHLEEIIECYENDIEDI